MVPDTTEAEIDLTLLFTMITTRFRLLENGEDCVVMVGDFGGVVVVNGRIIIGSDFQIVIG